MKTTVLKVIICLLLMLAAFQLGYLLAKQRYVKEINSIVEMYAGEVPEEEPVAFVNQCEGLLLDSASFDIRDVNGAVVDYKDLAGDKSLCARFSASGCRPCTDNLIANLKEFAHVHPDWHINLLIDGMPLRDMYVYSKEFGPTFSLYSADNIRHDFGSRVSPVIFRVNREGRLYRHFTCSPGAPERTAAYMSSVLL